MFLMSPLSAQNSDLLTNSAVLKMVNAKLSDELIIDVIRSSKVNFDLSSASVDELVRQKVSQPVIEAMKAASGDRGSEIPVRPDPEDTGGSSFAGKAVASAPETKPETIPGPAPVTINFEDNEAFGYVAPVADVISFHELFFRR